LNLSLITPSSTFTIGQADAGLPSAPYCPEAAARKIAFRPLLPLGFWRTGDLPSSPAKFSGQILRPSSPAGAGL
jgi:hypothetical protein